MELEEMITRQEILDALASYCRALDRMDGELFDGLWHAAAVIDYAGLYQGDAVGLRKYLWETHALMAIHSHQIGNVKIECDGEHVASEAYVTVSLWTLPDELGAQVEVVSRGRYLDRWVREGSSLRIQERVHIADMQSFRPLSSGRTDSGVARDRSDRSYQFLEPGA